MIFHLLTLLAMFGFGMLAGAVALYSFLLAWAEPDHWHWRLQDCSRCHDLARRPIRGQAGRLVAWDEPPRAA